MVTPPVSAGITPALPSVQEDRQQLDGTIRQLQNTISTLGSPPTKMFAATAGASKNLLEFLEAVIDCAKSAKNAVQGQLLLDADSGAAQLLLGRDQDVDGSPEGDASWKGRWAAAAAQLATSLLTHLQQESLVDIVDGR